MECRQAGACNIAICLPQCVTAPVHNLRMIGYHEVILLVAVSGCETFERTPVSQGRYKWSREPDTKATIRSTVWHTIASTNCCTILKFSKNLKAEEAKKRNESIET